MADSDRTQDASAQGNGTPPGAPEPWTPVPGLSDDPLHTDPFEDEHDPFADEGDPFAQEGERVIGNAASAMADEDEYASDGNREDELDLGDSNMRLPWLEGDDEDYEDERGGMGQTTLLLIFALVAVALLVGVIVWALRNSPGKELVADGGVIEAPAEPYKSRPANPGGDEVDGTGDTSFAVAEGEARTPKIASNDAGGAVGPGFESVPKAGPSAASPVPEAKAEEHVSGVGVQVAAYTSQSAAEKGWNTLSRQYPDLAGMKHRIIKGQADIGTVFRLQAVPGDRAAAKALCDGMRAAGMTCDVKD